MALFSSTTCNYCGKDPGFDPVVTDLWHGFYDTDLEVYVCQHCRYRHYNQKVTKGLRRYAERPVMTDGTIKQKQL